MPAAAGHGAAAAGHGAVRLKVSESPKIGQQHRQLHCNVVANTSHHDRGSANLLDPTDPEMRHSPRANLKYP